ncbi:MAG: murein hydrolase activator EnvC family protein [Saprospiraceae bacterium]
MLNALKLFLGTVVLLVLLPVAAFSQSKKDLEDKRKRIIREIETTNKLLKKTNQIKEATLDRYVALQSQIEQREDLIQTITAELNATDSSATRTAAVISSLTRDVQNMQAEYGRMMRGAFRRKMMCNPLLYILSAESLNQAFRRFVFLRKYDQYRRQQAEAIEFTKKVLAKKMVALEETRLEKAQLLDEIQGQRSTLTGELIQKNDLLQTLKKDESRLQQDLKQKAAAHEELNRAIERIIQEEVRKKIEEARKPKPKPQPSPSAQPQASTSNQRKQENRPTENPPDDDSDSDEDALSVDFRKNRGRLPWPVESGFIARKFGRQPHPTIPSIEITNNGIDIRVDNLTQVFAVFEGKVAGVQFIPGHDYTVIIQHGNYYTVYSNLREAYVEKGEIIKSKKSIGTISTNNITGSSELHFELWHQKERLNPATWIKKS